MFKLLICLLIFTFISSPLAAKRTARKTQDVNFNEVDIEGKVRSPDGSFLVQKKGIDFFPLYETKERVDLKILNSVHYLR